MIHVAYITHPAAPPIATPGIVSDGTWIAWRADALPTAAGDVTACPDVAAARLAFPALPWHRMPPEVVPEVPPSPEPAPEPEHPPEPTPAPVEPEPEPEAPAEPEAPPAEPNPEPPPVEPGPAPTEPPAEPQP